MHNQLQAEQHQIRRRHPMHAILLLALLLLLFLCSSPVNGASNVKGCDPNCTTKSPLAHRSGNCDVCCKNAVGDRAVTGFCGGGFRVTNKCMCNIPGQSCFGCGIRMPSMFGGGLCLSEQNAIRAQNRVKPLKYNKKLEAAAKKHNDWMIKNNCISHQCRGEPGLDQRTLSVGYRFAIVGENLVAGSRTDCRVYARQWYNSPEHRENLLHPQLTEVGCSAGPCTRCSFTYAITCVYAAPKRNNG